MAACVELLSGAACLWSSLLFLYHALCAWGLLGGAAPPTPKGDEARDSLLHGADAPLPPATAFSHPWAPPAPPSPLRRALAASARPLLLLARLLLLLALPFSLSLLLPPAWSTATVTWQQYASDNIDPSRLPVADYTLLPVTTMVDLSWLFGPNAGAAAGCCYVNMYKDVAAYYAALGGVLLLGGAGLALPPLRRALLRRPCALRAPALLPKLLPAPPPEYAPSVGELLLLAAWGGLLGYWLRYWRWGYQRILDNGTADVGEESAHAWARALGHVCTLTLSLALLPLARGSVWEVVFGVPYERALRFHRANGLLFWVAVTAHGGAWAAKWARQGLLAANLAATGTPVQLAISPGNTHGNNFTIPLVAGGWLVLTAAVGVALARRWLPWELFTATHTALLWVVLAAELHAWSHWYHTLGALSLYALDKVARGARGSVVGEVRALAVVGEGVAQLEVALPRGAGARVAPGAFFMVCVPELGALQWHPFTCASYEAREGRGVAVFDVKGMGRGTWSAALVARAEAARGGAAATAPPLVAQLEGPYGGLAVPRHARHVFAVAGGIGITPFLALARALVQAVAEREAAAAGGGGKAGGAAPPPCPRSPWCGPCSTRTCWAWAGTRCARCWTRASAARCAWSWRCT